MFVAGFFDRLQALELLLKLLVLTMKPLDLLLQLPFLPFKLFKSDAQFFRGFARIATFGATPCRSSRGVKEFGGLAHSTCLSLLLSFSDYVL